MKTQLLLCLSVILIITSCQSEIRPYLGHRVNSVHSLLTELQPLYNIGMLPSYLDSTFSAQVSSYDTTGGNDDGFSGRYSYLRKNSDGSLVIFDIKGSGVINRIWTPTPGEDTLDFYLDDTLKPSFSIFYRDLFSGRIYPFQEPLCGNQLGGYYCYMPIPFEKSCRIVTRGKKEQFHQIEYRLYEKGSKVKSFNLNPDAAIAEALNKIKALWNNDEKRVGDFYEEKTDVSSHEILLKPGTATTIFEKKSGGRILGIEISPATAFEGPDKNTMIKITWDGESTPAVWCPVADFFGYAFGSVSMRSLMLGSQNNKVYCYLPMPFDKSAKIELIQGTGSSPLNIKSEVWYTGVGRDQVREGKFYTQWIKDLKVETGRAHTFASVDGKGHYVGTVLQAQGLKAGMTIFFEGDDSTSIDGQCRLHGTGSEDYFNGGWYAMMDRWDDKLSLPMHGCLDYSLPFCRTGGYRFYISDKLSFEKSLFQSIEHGPSGNNFPADYTSLGLYYCDTPPARIVQPSPELTRVYMPDTLFLYPQLIDFTLFGKMNVETTWKYGTGGESYLFSPGPESWLRISLREIPAGRYSVSFDILKNQAGCEFSLWQRQKQLSDWIPSYNDGELRANDMYICDISVPETNRTMTLRFRTGKQRNSLLLNRIILIRK